jgi:4-hydroxy-tetrahydrodipicolinate synthase
MPISLTSAIGTPLTAEESLHIEGLEAHIDEQWDRGMTGLLIGGTMGAMQLLAEQTYRDLVTHGAKYSKNRGDVLVGVGDAGFARTRERIRFANTQKVDGVVVLSPYLFRFSPSEVTSYFTALADCSTRPLYLYDLPVLTGVRLDTDTVLALSSHRNIRGIKSSGDFALTRQLIEIAPPGFRVIVAQADLLDVLLRHGVEEHLDGVFSLAPKWVRQLADAALATDWEEAKRVQGKLSALLRLLRQYGVFPTFTALLNARGVPGNFAPAPYQKLHPDVLERILSEPVVRDLLREASTPVSARPGALISAGAGNGD